MEYNEDILELDSWSETYTLPHNINDTERDLVRIFRSALEKACPVSYHGNRQYKDYWYYDDEVKELHARGNTARKQFKRHRSDDNRELLQAAVRSTDRKLQEIREENGWSGVRF